jgi:predicted outer membrane repeat protein
MGVFLTLLLACSQDWKLQETYPEPEGVDSDPQTDDTGEVSGDADGDGVPRGEDCDDSDPDVGAPETWYADRDGDGWGDPSTSQVSCDEPDEFVLGEGDCDDEDATIHPDASEVCDAVDNDCDGLSDDDDDSLDASTATYWYPDADVDGYGDYGGWVAACLAPTGYVEDATDCDDALYEVNPGATEVCDDLDNDCDELIDEDDDSWDSSSGSTYYEDADGDGYGDPDVSTLACDKPTGWKSNRKDCDDTDPDISPDADEICDGVDNDCDSGTSEDGVVSVGSTAYSTITLAIAGAAASDTITVCDGTYYENLSTNKQLTLESLNGATSTILDGGNSASVITANAQLTVSGFTLQNGDGAAGGAIDAFTASAGKLVVKDCVITDNSATYGGGISGPVGYDLRVVDTEVKNNDATTTGGGVYFFQGELLRADIHDNEAEYGGGVAVDSGDLTADTATEVYDNDATYGGGVYLADGSVDGLWVHDNDADNAGGVYITGSASDLVSVLVEDNSADYGGGMLSEDQTGHTISSSTFSGNSATYSGGALYVYGGTMSITGTTLDGNVATYGGALFVDWDSVTSLTSSCAVTSNTASDFGGGALIYDGTMTSSGTDWGSGSTDNSPQDIYTLNGNTKTGGTASFSCTETGC